MEFKRVVIVGVGLLGGSIGLALRTRKLAELVIGFGRREEALQQAHELGAIDRYETDLATACRGADVVVACTPVQQIVPHIQSCASEMSADGLITDVGSTKASICATLADTTADMFCGSHPLAGSDKSGVKHADASLFVDKIAIVTPEASTSEELTQRTEQFWEMLGCRTVRMSPSEHDEAVAGISHMPHIVASALAGATSDQLLPLAASGWRDTTRVAAGNVEMWRQIISENRSCVLQSLQEFSQALTPWIDALERGDDNQIQQLLSAGKFKRDSVGN